MNITYFGLFGSPESDNLHQSRQFLDKAVLLLPQSRKPEVLYAQEGLFKRPPDPRPSKGL